jgi:enterochelin esterase-like enzyme
MKSSSPVIACFSARVTGAAGAGTTDMAREGTMNLHSLLEKQGFKTSYKEIPGAHYWFLWRDFLGDFGSILFR